MLPKVTILIPAYKDSFLKETLESLLKQTYDNYSIVIIDDASPYNLKQIVDEFLTDKIRYYRNEVNIGGTDLVKNWNKALTYADGDLVVLGSDDDLYHPEFIESLVSLSEKYPQVDIFHCRVGVIDEDGNPIFWSPSVAEYETDIDFVYQRAINRRTQLISDFMFRRRTLEQIGGFVNYPKAWYSDEMTVYKMAKGKGIACSQKTLFYWRSSTRNISSMNNDTLQKADASVQHIGNMERFLDSLTPTTDKDEFLLAQLKSRVAKGIKRQLIYDMAKASIPLNYRIFRRYPRAFDFKERLMLISLWGRRLCGV